MCKSSAEPGGPSRCSSDARSSLERSNRAVSVLEKVQAVIAEESDQSVFEPVTSATGHTLAVMKTRNQGIRTYSVHCQGCDDWVTPHGGFTNPQQAAAWARAYASSNCAPNEQDLPHAWGSWASISDADAQAIQADVAAGIHNPAVLQTRYRGIRTWGVFCPGCNDWISAPGGVGQANTAQNLADYHRQQSS